MIKTSGRSAIEPFHAMDVLAEATKRKRDGHPVISMAVGQPAHGAPRAVVDAARNALRTERIAYTDALGRLELRERISRHYRTHYGVDVDASRIAVTTGSSAGFNLAFLTMFNAGDRVAITRPGYPAYRNILTALGLEVVEIPAGQATDFTLSPGLLDEAASRHGRISGVLLASPANPTGTVTARKALSALIDYCDANRVTFLSDEIYHGLTYAGEETTALSVSDRVLVINSFSKYYCMTGWRIGWMVLPDAAIRPLERVAQSLYISAPELSQIAACAAFDATEELEAIKSGYVANRQLLLERLPKIGFEIASPMDGAFYAYVDAGRFTNDSMQFSKTMLAEINVAATPGRDFDPVEGHRTIRFSYAGSHAEMEEALDRMAAWLS
ncbi:pyridoxal phosphate-dependent aminotransferase [Hoeflea poritis]|uniref:aspartate transaminase n=1 Tax=Hoeflea poritis TaxID=2993659 RepID=A0ABT4VIC9_9HYPH|nr:aminotransferase class I/II-fold pyridoxal phosphate-dependent enzyme [Hoeflea poritis]MDA4843892.1 aminotransferase class I/II-fold pyridoxal phosphate-dependent enzyme [Hoeflea poritis]